MLLLRHIAGIGHMTELLTAHDIEKAQEYEQKGWILIKWTKKSKGLADYGQRKAYALITDAGRTAARGS